MTPSDIEGMAATSMAAIADAIRQYSMAVAPDWFVKYFFIYNSPTMNIVFSLENGIHKGVAQLTSLSSCKLSKRWKSNGW